MANDEVSFALPFKIATTEFSEAFCVPRSKVLEVLEKVYGLSATTSIRVAAFGHIGEGHIHLNIMSDKREDEVLIRGFIGKVVKEVVSIGGTLKAGQGVDDVKTEFVELELTDQEIGLMKDLKRMFDPKDIMNPGKIFT